MAHVYSPFAHFDLWSGKGTAIGSERLCQKPSSVPVCG
jgi:hypothetical protein